MSSGRDGARSIASGRELVRIGNNLNQMPRWANLHHVAAVAVALSFEHRYTFGVIAWSPDDTPTAAQVERVVDAFEKTAWTGLAPDRYAWLPVLHRDRGSGVHVHVHVFAARCGLATGRSLNIAPPGGRRLSTRPATPSTTSVAGRILISYAERSQGPQAGSQT